MKSHVFNSVSIFICARFTAPSGKANRLVSFISILTIIGLVLGVAILILVVSVMNGFERELKDRILNVVPHLVFIPDKADAEWQVKADALKDHRQVVEVNPFAQLQGMVHSKGRTRPIHILGFEQERIPSVFDRLLSEQMLNFPKANEVLLSKVVANALNVSKGDFIRVFSSEIGKTGTQAHNLLVSGLFATRTELDQALAITSISHLSSVSSLKQSLIGLRVQLISPFLARQVGYSLLEYLPYGYGFRDWFQTHGNLYKAIQLSRNMVGILILLIVAIAVFNVTSMMMMSVLSRRRDVAVLKTLGCSRRGIMKIFLLKGTVIGVFGIALGVIFGILGCYFITDVVAWIESGTGRVFLDTNVYPIDYIPVDMRSSDILFVALCAAILNSVATIYPALKASRLAPARELRFH